MHWQGGGGYGDPLLRDPAAVAHDLREQKVTERRARGVYGVVVADGAGGRRTATREPPPAAPRERRARGRRRGRRLRRPRRRATARRQPRRALRGDEVAGCAALRPGARRARADGRHGPVRGPSTDAGPQILADRGRLRRRRPWCSGSTAAPAAGRRCTPASSRPRTRTTSSSSTGSSRRHRPPPDSRPVRPCVPRAMSGARTCSVVTLRTTLAHDVEEGGCRREQRTEGRPDARRDLVEAQILELRDPAVRRTRLRRRPASRTSPRRPDSPGRRSTTTSATRTTCWSRLVQGATEGPAEELHASTPTPSAPVWTGCATWPEPSCSTWPHAPSSASGLLVRSEAELLPSAGPTSTPRAAVGCCASSSR